MTTNTPCTTQDIAHNPSGTTKRRRVLLKLSGEVFGAGGAWALDVGALDRGAPGVGGGAEDAGERAWHPVMSSNAATTTANGPRRPIPAA